MFRSLSRPIGAAVAAGTLLLAAPASAATIKVKSTSDEFGLSANCTLREAIEAANDDAAFGGCKGGKGADTIQLKGGKTYVRQEVGSGLPEDENASGDFDIASKIKISVKGKDRAVLNGGGIDRVLNVVAGGDLTASRLKIRDGVVYPGGTIPAGGGVLNSGKLRLTKSVITANEANAGGCACGGGIAMFQSKETKLDRVEISSNAASNIGGGLAYLDGKLRVRRSTISTNSATSGGGGVYLGGNGRSAAITESTISGNQATASGGNSGGGGIFVSEFDGTKLTVANSTIAANTTNAYGGGVFHYSGSLKMNAVTITGNTADADSTNGGGGGGVSGLVQVTNSIVAGNQDSNPVDPLDDCFGNATVSKSLTGKNTGCSTGNRSTNDPKLGSLDNNGGPTKTIALEKGSPAIDRAGKGMPKRDQRGHKRDNKPDLGAFER